MLLVNDCNILVSPHQVAFSCENWKKKSFENENVCDVLMNEIVMENEPL